MKPIEWLIAILLIVFVALSLYGSWHKKIECEKAGGFYARGFLERKCIKVEIIK